MVIGATAVQGKGGRNKLFDRRIDAIEREMRGGEFHPSKEEENSYCRLGERVREG